MTRLLLLLSFHLCCFNLYAQRVADKLDEVVYADGKTEFGEIERASAQALSRGISFKPSGSDQPVTLSPTTVREFAFARSKRAYRAVTVETDDFTRNGVSSKQRRFGEVLVDGQIELIRINLLNGEYNSKAIGAQSYMYLLRQGEIELPLELTSIYVYEVLHANPSRFRNKLKFLVRDCEVAFEQARRAEFNDESITRVLNSYAECKQLQRVQIAAGKIPPRVELKHFVRLNNLDLRDKNYDDQQFSFSLGYQLEADFTNRFDLLGIIFSTDYVYHSFRWEETSNVAQSMLKGNLSLAFYPVKKENFSVQLTAGLSNYNAFESSFSSFFSNNYFLFSNGLRLQRNNFLFELSYEQMPNHITRQPGNVLLAGVGYRLRW